MMGDSFIVTSSVLFIALTLITLAAMPKRDRASKQLPAIWLITAGTLLAYVSPSLPVFTLGWALTIVPYWVGWLTPGPRIALTVSTVALAAGVGLLGIPGAAASDGMKMAIFALLTLAILLLKGIFPFHSWVPSAFAQGELLPLGLLLNGHLGATLLVRFVIPVLPDAANFSLMVVSALALFTALYASVLALAEKAPRRILGLLFVSQTAFILAGLENRNTEGITGALVHFVVVSVATTGLLSAYRAVESRSPQIAGPGSYWGLSNSAPRLAVLFGACGLALIGLPGTLGFAAEDLLFHGSLESHPLLGITLPLATALNAITMYRLFSSLFLGRAANASPAIADALPRERWALSAAVCFLVITGIVPAVIVSLRSPAAAALAQLLSSH